MRAMAFILGLAAATMAMGQEAAKLRVAVVPIQGQAGEALRERTSFSLRAKLDRTGKYDVVDGPRMQDLLAESASPVSLSSTPEQLRELAKTVEADVVLWGELSDGSLKVKVLDLRKPENQPAEVDKSVREPTDLRFAVEEVLKAVPGVGEFEHPVETAVWEDAAAKKLWATNPNLVSNGDFKIPGRWTGIYQAELYPVPLQGDLPLVDKVAMVRNADTQNKSNAIVLNLSKTCAENNGLAALSDSIKIEPNTRYRLSFRYKSDGPMLHVFVKGYTLFPSAADGKLVEREVYRRQVPPTGETHGQWVTITDDLNPQHVTLPVQTLKVDLYAYLVPGVVMFDEVTLKAVGQQTRQGKDAAIKPVTAPEKAESVKE